MKGVEMPRAVGVGSYTPKILTEENFAAMSEQQK
jgi:hypothetical protein